MCSLAYTLFNYKTYDYESRQRFFFIRWWQSCRIHPSTSSPRDTRQIFTTAGGASAFEYIKSEVQNSQIVGIGLGRGAEAAGSRAGDETVYGLRQAYNPTACNLSDAQKLIHKTSQSAASTPDYKNQIFLPSEFNFKGGDGAVIITW